MAPFLLTLIVATTTSTTADRGFVLVLSDVDGAVVTVDDQRVGTSPVPVLQLSPGPHQIVVDLAGYGRYETTVIVTAGSMTRIDAVVTPRALPRISRAERLGIRTDGSGDAGPLITKPWFLGVAAGVAAVVVAVGLVLASGGDFVPQGELGNSSTSDWSRP